MLSYRHAFHAGNHADVLKHFVQIQLHEYMNQKDTAYTYIDTHSGAGVYALDGGYASKNAEYDTGIGPLWERTDLPKSLATYVNLVRGMNPSGKMRYYPGSPYCADQLTREIDRLRLFELHPADSKILADNFRKVDAHAAAQGERQTVRGKRVIIERGDGFHGIKTLLPPPSRRALVLVDPPYEDKMDYRKVRDMLEDALGRFPTGTYAVWYPVLQRIESRNFADKLKRLPAKDWLHVTLTVMTPGPDGFGGLASSGMFILNPPYTLLPTLQEVMPYLVKVLGKDAGATFVLESGTPLHGTSARLPANGERRAPAVRGPLAGTGSLRLPGQAPAGTPVPAPRKGQAASGTAGSGRPGRPGAISSTRPGSSTARPGSSSTARPASSGTTRAGEARPAGPGARTTRPGSPRGPRRP